MCLSHELFLDGGVLHNLFAHPLRAFMWDQPHHLDGLIRKLRQAGLGIINLFTVFLWKFTNVHDAIINVCKSSTLS